ncbi:MAG: hypothetical protein IJ859_03795 [Synergistaceae bacterium]|nr:hypothetical protein [Synergistaceae bacterium]
MPKAKTIDRLELTRQKMAAREAMRQGHGLVCEVTPENLEEVQRQVLGYTKENSPFLEMREEMLKEHPELLDEAHTCPICSGELVRYEGCYRCKKCGWSKC